MCTVYCQILTLPLFGILVAIPTSPRGNNLKTIQRRCRWQFAMSSIGKVVLLGCLSLQLSRSGVTAFAPHRHIISDRRPVLKLIPSTGAPIGARDHRQTAVFGSSNSKVVPGVGDEGCALPSPSMVNTLPVNSQLAVVLGYCLALYGGSVGLVTGKYLIASTHLCKLVSLVNCFVSVASSMPFL